ncbi:MAG: zeta toxin family protein [Terriglobales bacterium]|jgi:predicted ABC-type ATPase
MSKPQSMRPKVYIIAGPNGAGKTTFARKFLPLYANCTNFINADLIAQGLSPFSPDAAVREAGRLMLGQIDNFARRRADFSFETTLSGRGHLNLVRRLKDRGFEVSIFFLWLATVDDAIARIRDRVLKGGHTVPDDVVHRRFERSIRNFLWNYRPLADTWILFENSGDAPIEIAFKTYGKLTIIKAEEYSELLARYGEL